MDPFAASGTSPIFRSLFAIDPITYLPISSQYTLVTDGLGGIVWQDPFATLSTFSATRASGIDYLPSSIYSFSTQLLTLSTITGTTFSSLAYSIASGGIPGSITSNQLTSTVAGIYNPLSYVSTGHLTSTVDSFIGGQFSYSLNVVSTNIGLATYGYVSTSQLTSTTTSLATSIVSSVAGLSGVGYISTSQLTSSLIGLGTLRYISAATLNSTTAGIYTTTNSTRTSSLIGLGTFGYVSTSQLISTGSGLLRNVSVDRVGNLNVYNSQVVVSSLTNFAFLSSFYMSSLIYSGNSGPITVSTSASIGGAATDVYFSTALLRFSAHSNYIIPSTKITLDYYPNFVFSYMNNTAATKVYPISTMVVHDNIRTIGNTNNAWMVANGFTVGQSNSYQVPMRVSLMGADVMNTYDQDCMLLHRIPNSLGYGISGGFQSQTVNLYTTSTNSLYITVQNLPIVI
jgi:hypothetical protein